MRSGRMPLRVEWLRRDSTLTTASGMPNGDWEPADPDHPAIWAGMEAITGNESWQGNNYASQATVKFFTRYWADMKRTDRFRFEGKDYDILDIVDARMQHRGFEIPAKYVSNMGDGAEGIG